MTNILEITDGTTTVNLLSTSFGLCLNSWNPQIAQAKGGGVFQSSSLSQGRQLVDRKLENVQDAFNFDIKGNNQPETILYITKLITLLEQATDYWVGIGSKVYLKAKADCEDEPRYALITNYTWSELKFPYGGSFFSKVSVISSMSNVDIGIEHGLWSNQIPGESECVEISGVQSWIYDAEWELNDTTSTSGILDMLVSDNGYLWAVGSSIIRSIDNGVSWASNQAISFATVGALAQSPTNLDIYCNEFTNLLKTADYGATAWTIAHIWGSAGSFNGLLAATNGYIFAAGDGDIYRSIDDGGSFAVVSGVSGTIRSIAEFSDGVLFAMETDGPCFISTDSTGASWIPRTQLPPSPATNAPMVISQGDNIFALTRANENLYKSIDRGITWFSVFSTSNQLEDNLLHIDANNRIYINDTTDELLYYSDDEGISWASSPTFSGTDANDMIDVPDSNGDLYYGVPVVSGNIYKKSFTSTELGSVATCDNQVFIANRGNVANLTDIKIDDGGVFTDIFPIAAFPQDLLPATPIASDAIYFGINTSVDNSGPFGGLIFDISQLFLSSTLTGVWEYYNGGWVTLTVHDETAGILGSFGALGINGIYWDQPNDWTAVAIDSITAYWVRFRVSVITGFVSIPQQQSIDIYAPVLPCVNIAQSAVIGEIPALSRMTLQNRSDEDGRGGNAPNLYENRIISGLRSISRGSLFNPYIDCSTDQNPQGISITVGTNTTIAADTDSPSGMSATYNPAGVEAMATRVTLLLGATIATDYYGKFHAFLRVQRTAGSITDFDIQLQYVSGSGGIQQTTTSKQVQTTTDFELIDFGQVELPIGGTFKLTDLGDVTEIRIQASAASGTPDLIMYDLILMPVDEWSIDAVDFANTDDSIVGRNNDISKYLDIDSVTNPRIDIQSLVRTVGDNLITSVYDSISPQEAILQANAQQKIWFLAAQTDQTGTQTAWIAPPEIVHTVQVYKNERYLTFSGGVSS